MAARKQRLEAVPTLTNYGDDKRDFYMTELSLCGISKMLWAILNDLPQFKAWDEIVGVEPILRNVCIVLRDDRRHNYAFNRKFDEEHPDG